MSPDEPKLNKATNLMSKMTSPAAASGIRPSRTIELLGKLTQASTRLQRIRILLTDLQRTTGAERVGLIVAQSAETIYWADRTEHPEPYWVDNHETHQFDPMLAWAERQPSGVTAADPAHLPVTYGIDKAIVLRDHADAAGIIILCGAKLDLTRIFDNSLQIGNQIENALSVDRYDPETDEYHMLVEQVDLVELRREICDRYIQVAQGKKITFKVPYVRGAANVMADRGMVTRAITNLIDNALKFTPEGGAIEVQIVRGKGAMQVVVKDTGPGITPENLERIFERKVRIRQARHIRGLGLGLYIVKNVALKHGGRAWVESTPGEGSTFFLTLPVKSTANGSK
jgi:signal transduction histidine kinase